MLTYVCFLSFVILLFSRVKVP